MRQDEIRIDSEVALAEHIRDLQRALEYCPDTGVFRWRRRDRNTFASDRAYSMYVRRYMGKRAGSLCRTHGYIMINIFGAPRRAHRLAWLLAYGEIPSGEIDHINGVRHDNKIKNLRDVSRHENSKNMGLKITNKSGVCGVSWDKKNSRWVAQITHRYRVIKLGRWADKFEAICARKSAENKYGFHANHGALRERRSKN